MTSPMPLLPGDPDRLGPYVLRGRLGVGGMGVVYLGEGQDGRQVAIKVIRPEFATDPAYLERFRREAELARRVAQSCVAEVLAANPNGSQPYLVTEYVAGVTLEEHVRERGPLSQGNLEAVALGVAAALAAIHKAGLVHRDLKPSNVLLSNYYGPRVIDFGIARALDETSRLTAGRAQPGTPAFMAPEQFADGQVTAATDVFAWGGLVIFAATSNPPFGESGGIAGMASRVAHDEPRWDDLRAPLRELVISAMAKDPSRRPEALDLVHRLLGGSRAPVRDPQAEAIERVAQSWDWPTPRVRRPAGAHTVRGDDAGASGAAGRAATAEATTPAGSWPVAPSEEEARAILAAYAGRHWLIHDSLFGGELEIVDCSRVWLQEQWIEETRAETWEKPRPGSALPEPNLPRYSGPVQALGPLPVIWRDQRWRGLRDDSISVTRCDCADGKVRCSRCDGHGSIACRACRGRGSDDCSSCSGRGWQRCPGKGCMGGQVRCPQCEGHLRYTVYRTGTIDQVLHATRGPPSSDFQVIEVTPGRFDATAIPDGYHATLGGEPRQAAGERDLRRRILVSVLPSFRVTYHDGTAPRVAYLVGDPPNRIVRDADEARLSVRLLRLRQRLGGLLVRLRARSGRSGAVLRIGLAAAVLVLLGAGLVLLVDRIVVR